MEKHLDIYAWKKVINLDEECARILGRTKTEHYSYVIFHGSQFLSSNYTPTQNAANDFWADARKYFKKILSRENLRECIFHNGKVPPLPDRNEERDEAQGIPSLFYNIFFLEIPQMGLSKSKKASL